MKYIRLVLVAVALASVGRGWAAEPLLIAGQPRPADFILAADGQAAPLIIEGEADHAVVRAVDDVRADIERVSGTLPGLAREIPAVPSRSVVIAGIVGRSPLLDRLVAAGKLDVSQLSGAWESYIVTVIALPLPGVDQALVIAGSDRRGAIYGLYEISNLIGVSPWYWWADVVPERKSTLTIAAGTRRFGPPSVKYRGIFINDEDWGLQPWAEKTLEPENGGIGPKTYAKVFELLLRLKANTLWPGMHPTTPAFNHDARNKQVADEYAIVMGSSHAEPMLCNNVGEWKAPPAEYNYLTNKTGVLNYWGKRVEDNGRYENIYTLGMRGIHDSNMQGPTTDPERIRLLEQIFSDQRALISKHVRPEVEQVPQMFCAYKEVLDLYRQGLRVPEDVTIVWPDDNFGYIRNFATTEERKRAGGLGIYYHLSYLGRPMSYLWLSTTPPALIWEEMHKAYEQGADRIWIANVGDLKPGEITMEFFLQMAWDIRRWDPSTLDHYLTECAVRDFGTEFAPEIASLRREYYLLNFQRKPEHLQWWLSGKTRRSSALTDIEVTGRLDRFAQLRNRVEALRAKIPPLKQNAFYQLVYYPILGAGLANERFFEGERGNIAAAKAADDRLSVETRYFNQELNEGKWRGIISLEPADKQWASMRNERWVPSTAARDPVPAPAAGTFISMDASHFTASVARSQAVWTVVPGLGRTGSAVAVLPTTFGQVDITAAAQAAPRLDYSITVPVAGEFALQVYLLPTHPFSGGELRFAIGLDDAAPALVSLSVDDGGPGWAQGVLDGTRVAQTKLKVNTPGPHTLHVYGLTPDVVIDKLVIDLGGLAPSYLGPISQP